MSEDVDKDYTKVNTSTFLRHGKVMIDDMLWTVTLPSAKQTLKISKNKRRAKQLEQKIENNTATDDEYKELDDIEDFFFYGLQGMFKDGTKDNSQVEKWMNETPMPIIMAVFEDIQKQAERKRD